MDIIENLIKALEAAKEELTKNMNHSYGNSMQNMVKDSRDPALAPKQVKVKALQAQIDAGTYKPDPKKIADKMIKEELTCSENGQWNLVEKNDKLRDLTHAEWGHLRSMKYPAAMKPHVKVHSDTMEIHEHGKGVQWRMPSADKLVKPKK